MPVTYVKDVEFDGKSSYAVQVEMPSGEEHVALIRYDKWTGMWAVLHRNGLIERFDTLLSARAAAGKLYG